MPTQATPHEGNAARLLMLTSVYPFEISLTNLKNHASPAIYIVSDVDGTADVQNLDLVIKNTTNDDYQLGAFTLSFRKGTLHEDLTKENYKKFSEILATAIGDKTTVIPLEDGGSIRFTVKKSATAPFLLKANTALSLALAGVYAAPGTGTRTSGYEVKFEDVQKVVGNTPAGPAFSFGRNAVLQVINHQGYSSVPVHFGVLGNNFLLNAPGTQEIAIFMQSLDGRPLAMGGETKFIFTFYASEKRDGSSIGNDGCISFGNRSEVNGIVIGTLPPNFVNDVEHHSEVDEHGRRDIIINPTTDINTSFAAFKFTNIQLSGASGLVKVHVTVENLPGYWDSNFEVTFIKGPMVMVGNQVGIGAQPEVGNALSVRGQTQLNGHVGIGIQPDGTNALSVRGQTHLDGELKICGSIGTDNADSLLRVSANTDFGGTITVSGNTYLSGDSTTISKGLIVKGTTRLEGALTLGVHSNISPFPTAMCVAYAEFDIITENKKNIFRLKNKGFNIDSMKIEIMHEPIPMSEDINTYCALNTYFKSGGDGSYYDFFIIFNGPKYNFDLGTRFESNGAKYYLSQRTTELNLAEQSTDVKEGSIWIFLHK